MQFISINTKHPMIQKKSKKHTRHLDKNNLYKFIQLIYLCQRLFHKVQLSVKLDRVKFNIITMTTIIGVVF